MATISYCRACGIAYDDEYGEITACPHCVALGRVAELEALLEEARHALAMAQPFVGDAAGETNRTIKTMHSVCGDIDAALRTKED